MRSILRWTLRGLLFVAFLVIGGGLAVLFGASRDDVDLNSIGEFSEATGLQVETDGTFQPVLWPVPGWQLGQIKVSDPDVAEETGPLLIAKNSLLTLAPRGLLQGTLNIGALWLDDVQINLPNIGAEPLQVALPERTPKLAFLRLRNAEVSFGEHGLKQKQSASLQYVSLDYAGANRPLRGELIGNWRNRQISGTIKLTSPARAARGDWVFADAEVAIDADSLTYAGRFKPYLTSDWPTLAGNTTAQIANPAGALSWLMQAPPDETLIHLRELTLEGRVETLPDRLLLRSRWSGAFHDTRVNLDATLRSGADWQNTGAGTVNAVARAGGLFSSHLNGSFARDQGISGDLSFSVLDLPGMFKARLFPAEYQLSNAKTGSVKARLSATPQGIALADARLVLGRDTYSGDAAIDLRGDRTLISLGTSLDVLQLNDWAAPLLQGKQPLEGILPDLDSDLMLEVNAQELRYQSFSAGPATVAISTLDKDVSFDLRRLDLAGGLLTGSLTTKPNSSAATLELTGAEIDSASVLKQFNLSGIKGILGGSLRADVPFPLNEQDWETVQAEGTFSLYQAEIPSIDLHERRAGPQVSSALAQADLSFSLNHGALTLSDVSLRDSFGEWSGNGVVALSMGALSAELIDDAEPATRLLMSGTLDAPTLASTSLESGASETRVEETPSAYDEVQSAPENQPAAETSTTTNDSVASVSDRSDAVATEIEPSATTSDGAKPTGPETAPLPPRPRR